MLHAIRRESPLALVLTLTLAAVGCGSNEPVGGLTNPNPGSVVDRDKASVRDDLPAPDLNAGQKEPIAEAASTSPSSTGTAAGTGAAGGQPGAKSESSPTSAEPSSSPPAKTNAGEASGGTRPSGPIKEGTPKGPQ